MTTEGPTRRDLPASRARAEHPQMELQGTVTVTGDIVRPVVPEDHWEVLGHLVRPGSSSG